MTAKSKAAPADAPSSFAIYPLAMLRTPIRSYRRFLALSEVTDPRQAVLDAYRDEVLRRALRVKSRALFAALERHERGVEPLAEDTFFALYRYLVRITTRSTPLMLFAGVGVAAIGDFEQVVQAPERDWRVGIFPSWSSILRSTRALLAQPAIRQRVRYRLSENVLLRGGVLCYFTEQEPEGSKTLTPHYKLVAMRNDPQLRELTREPSRWWSFDALVHMISAAQPTATQDLIEAYIYSLIDGGILLCNLEPPSIGLRPEQHLATFATAEPPIPELAAQAQDLLRITEQPLPIDRADFDRAWDALERHPWLHDPDSEHGVNHATLRRGTLTQAVLRIDARAGGLAQEPVAQLGELVLRAPALWQHHYELYRHAIRSYFADGTVGGKVPLLELTYRVARGATPESLLAGLPRRPVPSPKDPPPVTLDSYLISKFIDADFANVEQVELDVTELGQVFAAAGPLRWPDPPPIIESMFRCVHRNGKTALHHYGTSSHVGGLLNRFLHWNAVDPILLQLRELWQFEERLHAPAIVAEVTCGGGGRLRDLSQRPRTYRYQIVVNGPPDVAEEFQIPLHELSVYIADAGPVLFWERRGVQVIPRQLSSLVAQAFSSVVHVLLALDPQASDWGLRIDQNGLPIQTPRLCYGDLILQPRSFMVPPAIQKLLRQPAKQRSEKNLRELLSRWRERYQVPRFVRVGDADCNAVDLDGPLALIELADMVQAGRQRVFEEYLEATSPIVGDDGPLVGEAVVHLRFFDAKSAVNAQAVSPRASILETAELRPQQVYSPGSAWLFLKLYYGAGLGSEPITRKFLDEDLLGRCVAPLIAELEKSRSISEHHFVRYADPEAHLRLRLKPQDGNSLQLLERIRERLDAEVRAGAFARWVVATYDRETDRYGGTELITAAESLFTIDSRLCLRMLSALHRDAIDEPIELQVLLPIRTLQTLYRCFGYDLAARLASFTAQRRAQETARPSSAAAKTALDGKYRQHSRAIQRLILYLEGREEGAELAICRRKDIAAWYRAYEQLLRAIAATFLAAAQRGTCSRPIDEVLPSIFHMHCNRLLGSTELEDEVIYLSQRATEAVIARLKHAAAREPSSV